MKSPATLLFPGQGAYLPGALAALNSSFPDMREVLDAVDAVAAEHRTRPVSSLLLERDAPAAEELVKSDPARSHLAIYACSTALYRVMAAYRGLEFDVLVGHSFGEIAALAAAGAVSVADGARMVAERDAAFQARPPVPGGMLSLALSETRTRQLLCAAALARVEVAAVNAPHQTVVSGPEEQLAKVESAAGAIGVQCGRLRAPYSFHNRALWPVAEEWAARIASIPVVEPRCRVYSPIVMAYYGTGDDLRAAIVSHLTRPVRFADAVRELDAQGMARFVECGARSILTDLVTQNLVGADVHAPLRRRDGVSEALDELASGTPAPAGAPAQAPTPPSAVGEQAAETGQAPGGRAGPSAGAAPDPARLPERAALLGLLRQEYARALDYPEDVFADDADLEADLGVDSLKQVEMFARLRRRFGLSAPGESVRVAGYRTLPAVADGLIELASGAVGLSAEAGR